MPDPRPTGTPMDDQARAIVERELTAIRHAMGRTYAGIVALDGPVAQRENDALSAVSELAAFSGAILVARLAHAKKIELREAWAPAMVDLQLRIQNILRDSAEQLARTVQ